MLLIYSLGGPHDLIATMELSNCPCSFPQIFMKREKDTLDFVKKATIYAANRTDYQYHYTLSKTETDEVRGNVPKGSFHVMKKIVVIKKQIGFLKIICLESVKLFNASLNSDYNRFFVITSILFI